MNKNKLSYFIALVVVNSQMAIAVDFERNLQVDMNYSRLCKMDCIDRDFDFCQEPSGAYGVCCESASQCAYYQEIGYQCTFDIKYTKADGLYYWLCPTDFQNCGDTRSWVVSDDGTEISIAVNNTEDAFTFNSVCSYELSLPDTGVDQYDQLLVYGANVVNADIYVSIGNSFDSNSMAEVLLVDGAGVYIMTPNKAFITVVA